MSRHPRSIILAGLLLVATGCDTEVVDPVTAIPVEADDLKRHLSAWSAAMNAEEVEGTHQNFNTSAMEGCPFVSADGRRIFMASTRDGEGGLDIWMATRKRTSDPWGEPVNVGPPINTPANDFCPTLAADGHEFFFASTRDGGCGGSDIYISRLRNDGTFAEPRNLGCNVNSSADEHSPFPVHHWAGPFLYFSSFRPGGYAPDPEGAPSGDSDIYLARRYGKYFGPAHLAPGLNTAAADGHPNVSQDGLEIVFFSARDGGVGGPDIYSATRKHPLALWSTPANLGPNVNSSAGETRPSLSSDRQTLYFGSDRIGSEGGSDIYVSTREWTKDKHKDKKDKKKDKNKNNGKSKAKRW